MSWVPLAQIWHCGHAKFEFCRTKHNVNSDASRSSRSKIKKRSISNTKVTFDYNLYIRNTHSPADTSTFWSRRLLKCLLHFLFDFSEQLAKQWKNIATEKIYCINRRLTIQSSYFFQKEKQKNLLHALILLHLSGDSCNPISPVKASGGFKGKIWNVQITGHRLNLAVLIVP